MSQSDARYGMVHALRFPPRTLGLPTLRMPPACYLPKQVRKLGIKPPRPGRTTRPPEDCGGVPGFHNLLEAISDPGHEQHEEFLEWLGDSFDPQAFSVDEVNGGCSPCSASQRSCRLQGVSPRMLFREMGQPNPLRRLPKAHIGTSDCMCDRLWRAGAPQKESAGRPAVKPHWEREIVGG